MQKKDLSQIIHEQKQIADTVSLTIRRSTNVMLGRLCNCIPVFIAKGDNTLCIMLTTKPALGFLVNNH